MRPRKKEQSVPEEIDLADRLWTALLAPLMMNLSLLILILVFNHKPRDLRQLMHLFNDLPGSGSIFYVIALGILPCILGFLAGSTRFARFMGHCFMTNSADESNPLVTIVMWATLLGAAYLVMHALPTQ